jgi:hypothetical protein
MADLERIGRADDVIVLVFSEFGRRVPENTNLGTDHGTAGLMFVIGKPVKGGHYGEVPSLTELTEGDNLRHTTDFRRVYATATAGFAISAACGFCGRRRPALLRQRESTLPDVRRVRREAAVSRGSRREGDLPPLPGHDRGLDPGAIGIGRNQAAVSDRG